MNFAAPVVQLHHSSIFYVRSEQCAHWGNPEIAFFGPSVSHPAKKLQSAIDLVGKVKSRIEPDEGNAILVDAAALLVKYGEAFYIKA